MLPDISIWWRRSVDQYRVQRVSGEEGCLEWFTSLVCYVVLFGSVAFFTPTLFDQRVPMYVFFSPRPVFKSGQCSNAVRTAHHHKCAQLAP